NLRNQCAVLNLAISDRCSVQANTASALQLIKQAQTDSSSERKTPDSTQTTKGTYHDKTRKKYYTQPKLTPRVGGTAAHLAVTMGDSMLSYRLLAPPAPAPTPSNCSQPVGRPAF